VYRAGNSRLRDKAADAERKRRFLAAATFDETGKW
jgi:hypothetical protein